MHERMVQLHFTTDPVCNKCLLRTVFPLHHKYSLHEMLTIPTVVQI